MRGYPLTQDNELSQEESWKCLSYFRRGFIITVVVFGSLKILMLLIVTNITIRYTFYYTYQETEKGSVLLWLTTIDFICKTATESSEFDIG